MTPRRVFILGCHRCGTTLMRLILNSHKDIHCFDEWYSYKMLETEQYELSDGTSVLGFKIPNWTDLLVDTEEYKKYYKGEPILFMMRDVRAAIASMLTLSTGKGNWFRGAIQKMDEEWPDDPNKAKFFEYYGSEFKNIKGCPESDFRKMALFWKYKTSKYLDMLKLGWKVLPISYESLVQFSTSYMSIISKFLEIEWDDNLLNHHNFEHEETKEGYAVGNSLVSRAIDTNSVWRWKGILTESQERAILDVAGEWNDFVSILPFGGKKMHFPNYQKYMEMKHGAKDFPEIEVDEEEFIRLMMETGKTEKESRAQAKVSKGLGASTMIGDKMVKIKEEP